MSIGVVLLEPEQPGNAGAIGRTCLCAGAPLHLIGPLGFKTSDRFLKRAGLDYWPRIGAVEYTNYKEFAEQHKESRIWYMTTKAPRTIADVSYQDGDLLMFGKESAGIPEEILIRHHRQCIRIPMAPDIRSLNLSNSVAIVLYEALRQQGFKGLEGSGHLHRLNWKD